MQKAINKIAKAMPDTGHNEKGRAKSQATSFPAVMTPDVVS
jgi:hypothetical protein